jgi:glycosyltransferase involved in cell wall biosynthesis
MKKIAFVVQRYGEEISGGAELHCRQLAERLKKYYQVSVITTCARDYLTWENVYPPGETRINQIPVTRFPTEKKRNVRIFSWYSKRLYSQNPTLLQQIRWMVHQGPYVPSLIEHLDKSRSDYDAFIFFTYLYYPTWMGLQTVPEKSLLIPTAHDEPPIYFPIYRPIFHLPRLIIYNTDEEKNFIHQHFQNREVPHRVIGVGVDIPPEFNPEPSLKKQYNLPGDYLLYVGRVDVQKGCRDLIAYFINFSSKNPGTLKLVLMGEPKMRVPRHPDILSLGRVPDDLKFRGIKDALAVVLPSPYESLSMVALEAWSLGRPVLARKSSRVLEGHLNKSGGGMLFETGKDFHQALDFFLRDKEERGRMGQKGRTYVERFYHWELIENKYLEAIAAVTG